MGIMRAIVVILSCVLVHVESMAVKKVDTCGKTTQCTVALKVDKKMYMPQWRLDDFVLGKRDLDQFCRDAETAKTCVNKTISGCGSNITVFNTTTILKWAKYVCEDYGREEIRILKKSVCAHSLKLDELKDAESKCINTFFDKFEKSEKKKKQNTQIG